MNVRTFSWRHWRSEKKKWIWETKENIWESRRFETKKKLNGIVFVCIQSDTLPVLKGICLILKNIVKNPFINSSSFFLPTGIGCIAQRQTTECHTSWQIQYWPLRCKYHWFSNLCQLHHDPTLSNIFGVNFTLLKNFNLNFELKC